MNSTINWPGWRWHWWFAKTMRNQPGVEHEKAWPQLRSTLCLRKHLHRDSSSWKDGALRNYTRMEERNVKVWKSFLLLVSCAVYFIDCMQKACSKHLDRTLPSWGQPTQKEQQASPGRVYTNSAAPPWGSCEQLSAGACSQAETPCQSSLGFDSGWLQMERR